MARRITILTSGSWGDVQPYIALGLGLQRAGFQARIATHPSFAPAIAAHGVDFSPVEGNPHDLLARPSGQAALVYDGSLRHSLAASWRFMRAARGAFERMLETAWIACQGAEALIVSLPTTWGAQIAERLDIPCVWGPLQPLTRTRSFPTVFQPFACSLGGPYNWLSHLVVEQSLWQPWRASLGRWRRETLGLPPLPLTGPFGRVYAERVPFVYGYSAHVAPRPADWPAHHDLSGYWFLDAPPNWRPPADLSAFLADGPPPVAVGFGSMGNRQAEWMVMVATEALARLGQRGILAVPPHLAPRLPSSVHAISHVPHAWLFPRVAAVVHHGGAGTTAAGLRAGLPAITAPVGIDQFFWGRRVAALGAGPPPIPRRALTAEALAGAIHAALHDPGMRQRAAMLGERLRAEDGVARAVEALARCC